MNKNKTSYREYMTAANGVTLLRMLGTIGLCFPVPMSAPFFVLYALTGLTDALDGWIARRTGTASRFGAKLDSIADLLFYGVMLVRLLPILWERLPRQIWYAVGFVLLLRLSAYLTAAIKFHCFTSLHTYLNKATGGALFLLPLLLAVLPGIVYSWIVCVLGCAASLEELVIHLCRNQNQTDVKCLLQCRKTPGE